MISNVIPTSPIGMILEIIFITRIVGFSTPPTGVIPGFSGHPNPGPFGVNVIATQEITIEIPKG